MLSCCSFLRCDASQCAVRDNLPGPDMMCRGFLLMSYNTSMVPNNYKNDKYTPSYVPPDKYRPKPVNPNKKVEKVWGFTVLSFLGLMATFAVKYVVDFLVLPKVFPDLFPFSIGALIVWLISSLLFIFLALKFISRMGFFYPVVFIVYAVLVWIFPMGLYGLAEIPSFAGALLAYAVMCLIERVMLWIFILIGFVTM